MKRLIQRVALVLTTLATIFAGAAIAATPAQAAEWDCAPLNQNRVCVWTNDSASGAPTYYWTIPIGVGGYCIPFGSAINDKVRYLMIDSAGGTAGRSATMYQHAGCSGNANAFVGNPPPDAVACWAYSWWPGCGSSLSQGSSIWVIRG